MPNDYIGAITESPKDLKQYGRKGMKWGVRRSRSELAKEGPPKSDSKPSTPEKKTGNIQDNVESSAARYDRLAGQAKAGRASDMTEADLKFFNARSDALAKIEKLNETKPGWLADTSKKVLQNAAERQMSSIADTLADKYIGAPIKDAIKGAAKKD